MRTLHSPVVAPSRLRPPNLDRRFIVDWADQRLVDTLIPQMQAESRQTMNLRTGLAPKLLVCRQGREPIGWAGLDITTFPEYPELFSLYLYPRFRRYTIGLLLETARWKYLDDHGIEVAYGRMEIATNFRLFRYRLSTGLFTPRERGDFPEEWVRRCEGCELHGRECTEQRYIAIDVKRALQCGQQRLGEIDPQDFPREFELRPDASGPPAATGDTRQAYRPYWI